MDGPSNIEECAIDVVRARAEAVAVRAQGESHPAVMCMVAIGGTRATTNGKLQKRQQNEGS